MKTFEQFMEEDRKITTVHGTYTQKRSASLNWEESVVAREAWNACAQEYDHELANKRMALDLQKETIASLERQLNEMKQDLDTATQDNYLNAGLIKQRIRQKWQLDEVKNG